MTGQINHSSTLHPPSWFSPFLKNQVLNQVAKTFLAFPLSSNNQRYAKDPWLWQDL